MLIPYPYIPTTQDVWLYEDHEISWSLPTAGTATIKRPYAWNPNSPLYGYRNSLVGMSARPRPMGTDYGFSAYFDSINPKSDPVNRPVWFNSWPMTMLTAGEGFMLGCKHCYSPFYSSNRDASNRFVGSGPNSYPVGSFLAAMVGQAFRFIDGDNQVTQFDPADITVYMYDPPSQLNLGGIDLVMFEYLQASSVPRLHPVDARSLALNATAYVLDSNHKIVRLRSARQFVQAGRLYASFQAVNPDGSVPQTPPVMFMHDSGSFALVEIAPPTSAQAGDGIMGVCFGSNYGPTEWIDPSAITPLVFQLQADGTIATESPLQNPYVVEYLASRGKPMRSLSFARRTGNAATETVEQQILAQLTEIPQ